MLQLKNLWLQIVRSKQNNAVAEALCDSPGCSPPPQRRRRRSQPLGHPGHQDRPNGYLFKGPPLPGLARKWEDWELPCYLTSFLTVVILGVGLNAKPDLTIETWAHKKALQCLQAQQLADNSE
ncbi:hypothetical protein RHMOL_Rhmol04G0138400 [Rhododendron molle]|uniref:Uncharacterized protein n=1 Tax=Rhododendron molle TaxID=49168 RepID=A0ACC0P021_RHOML|nr:hypothetical protein RHMOL_Rhmol04G0138400 [Rhododendron molle]